MPTGAQLIVDLLEDEGVEVAFGLPGVHNLALWEALRGSPIRLVGVRHEQAAAYAADGYARATGRLGVALDHHRPGRGQHARRGRRGVGVALADPRDRHRHPGGAAPPRRLPRRAARGDRPGRDVRAGGRRRRCASPRAEDSPAVARGRSRAPPPPPAGPSTWRCPTDLLSAEAAGRARRRASDRAAAPAERRRAPVEMIDAAERPLIWAGGGARRTRPSEVGALAERLAAPVITTYGARGLLPAAHPCAVGMPPHVEAGGRLWDDADLVISVGSDLDGVQTQNFAQPQPPRMVAINLDADDATKNYAADVVLEGDAGAACARWPRACRRARRPRRARRRACTACARTSAARSTHGRCASSTRSASRSPTTGSWSRTCASPATGSAGFHTPAAPAQAADPARLGHARLRVPGGARRGARGPRPGRRDRRRRRLPLRAAASWRRSPRSGSR